MNTQQPHQNELTFEQLEEVCGGAVVPTETISLNYEKIEWTYSKDSKHDKWIDVLSIDWGMNKG